MGQDRVAAWPSPKSSSPCPEGRRESGPALRPECPPAALWACAQGKGLATWPLRSRHFVPPPLPPHPSTSAQLSAPPIVDLGSGDPGHHCLLPSTQASAGAPRVPCAPSHP
uniref:Uncharacterized protein n=1 Tax=Oryctolagus cuniculus TaxID=9986 RepID=A0A5F9DRH1_RABIT